MHKKKIHIHQQEKNMQLVDEIKQLKDEIKQLKEEIINNKLVFEDTTTLRDEVQRIRAHLEETTGYIGVPLRKYCGKRPNSQKRKERRSFF